MERMFLLKEVFEGKNLSVELAQAIPESELNRRLIAIHKLPEWEDCEKGISILRHGDGQKREEWTPKQLAKHLKEHPEQEVALDRPSPITENREKEDSNFGHFLKACDSQPSPTPTREEWKLWIQDLPRPATDWTAMDSWLDKVEIWLEHGPWMKGK